MRFLDCSFDLCGILPRVILQHASKILVHRLRYIECNLNSLLSLCSKVSYRKELLNSQEWNLMFHNWSVHPFAYYSFSALLLQCVLGHVFLYLPMSNCKGTAPQLYRIMSDCLLIQYLRLLQIIMIAMIVVICCPLIFLCGMFRVN